MYTTWGIKKNNNINNNNKFPLTPPALDHPVGRAIAS